METTLVIIKPDCVQKCMIGTVIGVLENSGMSITGMRFTTLTEQEASSLYKEHKGKWHFDRNIKHVTSGLCVLLKVEGTNAVAQCRDFVKSFRQSHQMVGLPRNLIHATPDPSKVYEELEAVGFDNPKKICCSLTNP